MEWKEVRLGDCIGKIVDNRGKSAPTNNIAGIPLLEVNAIGGYSPNYSIVRKYVDYETYTTWFRSGHPQKGDILITTVGTIGIASLMDDKEACIAQNLIAIRANDTVVSQFLYYYLTSDYIKASLLNLNIGGVQPSIKVPHLLDLKVKLPGINDQIKVAAILSSLDRKIELNNKINAQLEEMAQTLFKHWFVDFGPFKDGKFIESELGLIPEGWRVGRLEEVAEYISRGLSPKYSNDTDEWILGQTCVRNNIVTLTNARKHLPKKKNEKWVKQWDVLLNSTGVGSLGRVGIVYFDKDNVALDSHITVVRVSDSVYRHYVGRNLLNRQDEIENMAIGSTGQTELPRDSVKTMKIIIPDSSCLSQFNTIIESSALKMYANIQENLHLSALRDTLLPKLMSGEINLENYESKYSE